MNAKIIEILEKHSVKPTAMRILILEQMLRNPREHLSLAQLEALLYPSDRITIYRTLQTFVKKGIAHTSENIEGTAVYGFCTDECNPDRHIHTHPHFICEKCKRTTCTDDFHYSLKSKKDAPDHIIKDIEITIKGICAECSKEKA